MDVKTQLPLGFPIGGYPGPQGMYYCSVGGKNTWGRKFVEEHADLCIAAGLNFEGINQEVAAGQWEFQLFAKGAKKAGDEIWVARYLLDRLTEKYGYYIDYHPKPVQGDWNGSGCHTNFSTKKMREAGGYEHIINAIEKLKDKHTEHMLVYGKFNNLRCSGEDETASFNHFSYGVADRTSSIRIPRETEKNKCGHFEDRRPVSNMDPYLVTAKILETVCQ